MLIRVIMLNSEQHKTNKWVRSSYVSAYSVGVLTCLCLCYAYALVRTSLEGVFSIANDINDIPLYERTLQDSSSPIPGI